MNEPRSARGWEGIPPESLRASARLGLLAIVFKEAPSGPSPVHGFSRRATEPSRLCPACGVVDTLLKEASSLAAENHSSSDELLLARLERDARYLASRFRLRLTRLDKESAQVKRRFGSCDSDGVIRIRLHNRRNGDPLKYSSLVATLCHELAHLKYLNHGSGFRVLYAEILTLARAHHIYRPRAVVPRGETSLRRAALNPGRRRARRTRARGRRPAR